MVISSYCLSSDCLKLTTERAIGGTVHQAGSVEAARKINIEYPLALAKLLAANSTLLANEGKKFRFLFISGALGERDMSKKLWFLSESRKMKASIFEFNLRLEHD